MEFCGVECEIFISFDRYGPSLFTIVAVIASLNIYFQKSFDNVL